MKNPPEKLSAIESPYRSTIAINILRAVVLLIVIGVSVYIFEIRDQAAKFAAYGYPGIFLVSILANGTILIPAPGIIFVFAMGGIFNPLIVGLVAGAGAAIGELSGYMAGFSGQPVAEKTKIYQRIQNWMQRYGMLTIFVLAAIPNPFFDLAGMSAGALKMPLYKFLMACLPGKIIKMWVFAYASAYSISWLFNVMK